MTTLANPFAKLDVVPADGRGINPLLVHPGMFFHPPMLMTGLVMVSVPFAFALGALLSKRVGDEWVDMGRVWGILAWAVLGIGLPVAPPADRWLAQGWRMIRRVDHALRDR